jgi:hypothetical protein
MRIVVGEKVKMFRIVLESHLTNPVHLIALLKEENKRHSGCNLFSACDNQTISQHR